MKKSIKCSCGNEIAIDYRFNTPIFISGGYQYMFRCENCGKVYDEDVKDIERIKNEKQQ